MASPAADDYLKTVYAHTEWQDAPITPSVLAAKLGIAPIEPRSGRHNGPHLIEGWRSYAAGSSNPRDQRAIKAAAETFRINPDLDVETAITELKVGEALVSLLQEDGSPGVVQRTLIAPPRSRLGPVDVKERAIIQSISPVAMARAPIMVSCRRIARSWQDWCHSRRSSGSAGERLRAKAGCVSARRA